MCSYFLKADNWKKKLKEFVVGGNFSKKIIKGFEPL